MEKIINKQNNDISVFILMFTVILTNLSQLPILVENETGRYFSAAGWIVLLLFMLSNKLIVVDKRLFTLLFFLWLFFIYILTLEIFFPDMYLNSMHTYPLSISMFIFICGFWMSKEIDFNKINIILWGYVLSSLIIAFSVYINYFYGNFSWDSRIYSYQSKNSISQIILTTIIIMSVVIKPKLKILKILKIFIVIFMIILLLMLKSRASILGIPLLFTTLILFGDKIKQKFILGSVLVLFGLLLTINDGFYNLIVNDILFAGRDFSNFNDLTSDRYSHYTSFPSLFSENPFIGRGVYWLESFPLSILIQYGLIGALPLLVIALFPLIWGIRRLDKNNSLNMMFISLCIIYLFNGFFEALAPFGPGVKNYFLWLMFGILYYKNRKIKGD